jgi:hypothetical protein
LQAAPLEHADAPHLLALLRARQRSAKIRDPGWEV